MNQRCKVCEEPAAGFHFGAFTCEGCKSFFGRAHTNPTAAAATECKTGGGRCVIDKKNRTSCKACRLKKCLAVGMSKSGSRYGRRSNWFKIHCLIQQQQQQQQQQHQLQRQQKRRISRGGAGDREVKYSGVSKLSPLPPPPSLMLPLPVPVVPMPLFFGFAPKCWAPLPRSKHSAFRETVVCSRSDDDDDNADNADDDDDRPIDLTVRGQLCVDGDDDEDDNNNNETAGKYARKFRSPTRPRDRKDVGAATPLDLTRANRNFGGIRS